MSGGKRGSPAATGRHRDAGGAARRRRPEALRHLAGGPEQLARWLDEILSLSLDHVYLFDRAGKLLYVNLPAAAAFGQQREALLGKSWPELGLPSEVTRLVESQVRRVFASRRPEKGKVSFPTVGGASDFEYLLTPLEVDGDAVQGVVATLTDITEHTRWEQALKESEARYRLLFDQLEEAFAVHEILCDEQGSPQDYRFLEVNPAFERMTGLKASAILGRRALEVLPGLESSRIDTYGKVALTGQPTRFESSSADLGRHYEVIAICPRKGYFATLFVDVTERRRAEVEREQLLGRLREGNRALVAASLREQESAEEARRRAEEAERAVRTRDEFLSVAAHELKTPITILRGFSQAIVHQHDKTGTIDQGRLLRALKHIDQQTRSLNDLAGQLLDVSRLEAGMLVVAPEETGVSSVVDQALASIREVHPDRTFVVRDATSVRACMDPLRMEQAIANLVDNAVKFSPPDSPVEIDVAGEGPDQVVISVRDHGRGVPEEDRSRVFERFYQAHPKEHYGGMGLGLYISAQIVEMHGGTITCEAPEGGGSRFLVRLPLSGGMGQSQ